MSEDTPLKARVRARLREALGEPDTRFGRDHYWSLQPHPKATSINVVIEDHLSHPAVWIFDPNDHDDGVLRESIEREEQIGELIEGIQTRVVRVGQRFTPKAV